VGVWGAVRFAATSHACDLRRRGRRRSFWRIRGEVCSLGRRWSVTVGLTRWVTCGDSGRWGYVREAETLSVAIGDSVRVV
jgi:hypothetical protein